MSLKSVWRQSPFEVVGATLLVVVGLLALSDAVRLFVSAPPAASWTAIYIAVAGIALVVLAVASLGSSSRLAAANTVTTRIAGDILKDASTDEIEQVSEAPIPAAEAKALLIRAIGLLLLWAIGVPFVGYVIATGVFIVAYGVFVSKRRLVPTLVLAVVATGAFYWVFELSGVTLPIGNLF